MEIGGYRKEVDVGKLGPTMVIASSLVLAIRTASWPRTNLERLSAIEWQGEVEHSIAMARRVLGHLIARNPSLFQQKDVPWYQPSEDESPE